MSIIDTIKGLIGGFQSGATGFDELKAKGQEMVGEYGDSLNTVVDDVQNNLPGNMGDGAVDGLQEKLKDLTGGK